MHTNALAHESSPYLLQHQHNSVDWLPWCEEAFNRAQQQNKPILLSIGYSACHWCHVMAHESFEDETIGQLINQYFISIKVDREERPDVDRYYQHALALLGKSGGWPLTMFLTPHGKPFWGGTYFPPTSRYHLPAFTDVLIKIAHIYQNKRDELINISETINTHITQLTSAYDKALFSSDTFNSETWEKIAEKILQHTDVIHGGLSGAPKFPHVLIFEFLLHAFERTKASRYLAAVELLLIQLCKGGIYDHLGGGFARYSTDQFWLVPHFEKMLYDNALLITLLTHCWRFNQNPLFKQRIEETITWLQREMYIEHGGFASAQDADSAGEEGRFYVWDATEINDVLGSHAENFNNTYNVTAKGNWEGKNILNLLSQDKFIDNEQLAQARNILFHARSKRPYPLHRDDKVLADWNGLTIKALVYASLVFENDDWLVLAKKTFDFITKHLSNGDELKHSWCKDTCAQISFLEDYAAMANSALFLHQATADNYYLQQAEQWIEKSNQFYDENAGNYFQAISENFSSLPSLKDFYDGATPSGNSLMLEALVRFTHITQHDEYKNRIEKMINSFAHIAQQEPLHHAAFLSAIELWNRPTHVKFFGNPNSISAKVILHEFFQHPFLNVIISYTEKLHERNHIILCENFSCSPPLYTIDECVAWMKRGER